MDIKKYFKRIGLAENMKIEQTYDFLKALQYANVINVPYENLDLVDKIPLSLEPCDLYDKIVNRARGGYCFEVNGLLSHMLSEMGFETCDYLARYLRNETTIPFRRHRVVAVKCEGDVYIMDVGIGQTAPRYPLKLEAGLVQEQFGETYKFEKNEFGEWELYDLYQGKWRIFYSFSEERQYNIDFVPPSFYCEAHPDSIFNKTLIIAIKTEKGRKTIDDKTFKVFENEKIVHIEEAMSDTRRAEVLKQEFGLKTI